MYGSRRYLRELLAGHELHLVPGITSVLDARLAQEAGFAAVFTTGAGIANTAFGFPDIGLLTMTEVVEAAGRIARAVSIPVIADADTGYGNHINVTRTVGEMEHAGVAAIVIEDQIAPKRCGHFDGKRVVPVKEMVERLVAARLARGDPDLTLIARTDAVAVEGLKLALERARIYVQAGADVIFVEAPRNIEEMAAIPSGIEAPCMLNLVEGGLTPLLPARKLEQMGFRLVLYANLALRVAARSVERAFRLLRERGSSVDLLDDMFSWEERQAVVGLARWEALDQEIAMEAQRLVAAASRVSDQPISCPAEERVATGDSRAAGPEPQEL